MTIDWNVLATIASPIAALIIGVILDRLFENRPRLISYLGHVSGIRLHRTKEEKEDTTVNTHSVVLRNAGRKTAKNVRLGHNILPDYQVMPDIQHEVIDLPNGGKEILFPTLVPKKQITITYLYFPPTYWSQINTHIESDEGPGKFVSVLPTPQLPRWLTTIIWILIGYGVIGVIYTAYNLIRYFVGGSA